MSAPEPHTTTALQRYDVFVVLGDKTAPQSLAPVQTTLTPGRDTSWEVLRVWAFSIGYEPQVATVGPVSSPTYDPYASERGLFNGSSDSIPQYINPVAMIYHDSIALANLVQPFYYVPRSFEPIALQQPLRIAGNTKLVCLAGEIITANGDAGDRRGRGVTFGVEVNETRLASV